MSLIFRKETLFSFSVLQHTRTWVSNFFYKKIQSEMIKILQADDHPLFREGIRHLLIKQLAPEVMTLEASTIQTTLEIIKQHHDIDLILLDLTMPGMEDFAGFYSIEQCNPTIPIVILSASEEPTDIQKALSAGAVGYIPKSSTSDIMINALKLVLNGGMYYPDFPYPLETQWIGKLADEAQWVDKLTPRQRQVLELMAEGYSNQQIAEKLFLSENTVKHHVSAILNVLEVKSRTQAVIKMKEIREKRTK
jgi:DNA-binding NarL/FixJ family response regulator